jgi:hypothetical protein
MNGDVSPGDANNTSIRLVGKTLTSNLGLGGMSLSGCGGSGGLSGRNCLGLVCHADSRDEIEK